MLLLHNTLVFGEWFWVSASSTMGGLVHLSVELCRLLFLLFLDKRLLRFCLLNYRFLLQKVSYGASHIQETASQNDIN